jgi:aspartyl-tRNA(Asn)/glutamyl-tRNA(Gln) amidotransferase subunit A
VRLLEEQDAILIGKTNLDEFAMGSSTENSALLPCGNPWNLDMIPGGSSGGSAAAVAARLVPLSLGSDTGGSIRQPAALCGISGYKPTYGRVSRFGLVAFGSSLDQVGPFAHYSEDIALAMEVLGTHCERDGTSIPLPAEEIPLSQDLSGRTIGVPFHFLEELEEAPRALFDNALKQAEELGAKIVEVDLDILRYSIATYYILATAEASTNLARFDGVRYGKRSERAETLDQVYDYSKQEGFGHEVKRRIMLGTYVLSAGYQDAYYRKAQRVRTLMIESYKAAFRQCDLIAMPTTSGTAFARGSVQDPLKMYLQDLYTIGSNLAGVPSISIPIGHLEGLPYGMQLSGPQKADAAVCSAGHALAKHLGAEKLMPTQFEE